MSRARQSTLTKVLSLTTFKDLRHLGELINETNCLEVALSLKAHRKLFDLYKVGIKYSPLLTFYLKTVPIKVKDDNRRD